MRKNLLLFIISFMFSVPLSAQSTFRILHKKKPDNVQEINQRLLHFTDEILKEEHPVNTVLNANFIPVFSDEIYQKRN